MQRKRKIIIEVVICILVLAGLFFCLSRFLPPRTETLKRESLDPGESEYIKEALSTIFKAADFIEDIASATQTPESIPSNIISQSYDFDHYYLKDLTLMRDKLTETNVDFLEVHLEEMKMRLHKEGEVKKEIPILLKGDPQGWGGTAAGLYSILSGNRTGYSVIAQAYLPFSLKFYGKYYIHGEPYYAGGGKLQSDFSGGCLRVSDENAEYIYEEVDIGMPVLVIDKENKEIEYQTTGLPPFPYLSASSFLVADLDSGFVFAEKDSQKQLPVASITKLMTATVVAENVDLRKLITVEEKMLDGYGSTEGIEKGKAFRVVELFYPLLIESSNDAAEILSYYLGREKTLRLMNEKAKAISMTDTEFRCPSGYDPGNVATAQDLFYLARYILNNRPPLLEIAKGNMVETFREVSFDIQALWNKNVFINDPTFVGGKTGFIKTSKNTALFIFRFQTEDNRDRNIVIITLGSDDAKRDTQRIYIWLLKNYFPATPVDY